MRQKLSLSITPPAISLGLFLRILDLFFRILGLFWLILGFLCVCVCVVCFPTF